MAAIAAVFTISHVAALLCEDEDWLFDLSIDMFPEDGCLHVYGVGEDGVTAFTRDGIDNRKRGDEARLPARVVTVLVRPVAGSFGPTLWSTLMTTRRTADIAV